MSQPALKAESALPPVPIYRFSVEQYHRMIDAGILDEDTPVELLEGLIVHKWPDPAYPEIWVCDAASEKVESVPLPIHRFSVEEYHRMIPDILPEGEPAELLEGWIVRKMTRKPPHDVSMHYGLEQIGARLPAGWTCRCQSAVTTEKSEPEPDIAVVKGPHRRYKKRHPRPRDIGVLVEVADATLQEDRRLKGPLYARAGIPIYWIINLIDQQIEVYSEPSKSGYRKRIVYGPKDSVPLVLERKEIGRIPVENLLP